MKELGEEGAIQVFEDELGNLLLGAVGALQFEIVAQRLATEYNVDAIYENTPISTARWLTYPDEQTKKDFEREQALRLAKDAEGNPVYLGDKRIQPSDHTETLASGDFPRHPRTRSEAQTHRHGYCNLIRSAGSLYESASRASGKGESTRFSIPFIYAIRTP